MNVVLWILQVLLALVFLAHGLLVLMPPPEIAAQMNAALPRWFWLFLGVAEVLAAIGVTLPGVLRIQPRLVVWAAAGMAVVMISATIWHLVRSEWSSVGITTVLLAMAAVVLYMRTVVRPIRKRGA